MTVGQATLRDLEKTREPEPPLRMIEIFGAAVAALALWWVTTVTLIFSNFIPGAQPYVAGVSLLLAISAGIWLLRNRHRTGVAATYMSFTAGLLIWGFAESSFYTGFITGPPVDPAALPEPGSGPSLESFFTVVGISLHRELLAVTLAIVAVWQAHRARNPFGFYVFLMLFFFQQSAKLNVFLGVKNTGAELLPDTVGQLKPFMNEAAMNPLFPISITLITIVAWQTLGNSLDEALPRWYRIGSVLIGTMALLALLEHWFLMIPLGSDWLRVG